MKSRMSMESTGVQVKVESKVSSCIYMYLGVSYDEVPWVILGCPESHSVGDVQELQDK